MSDDTRAHATERERRTARLDETFLRVFQAAFDLALLLAEDERFRRARSKDGVPSPNLHGAPRDVAAAFVEWIRTPPARSANDAPEEEPSKPIATPDPGNAIDRADTDNRLMEAFRTMISRGDFVASDTRSRSGFPARVARIPGLAHLSQAYAANWQIRYINGKRITIVNVGTAAVPRIAIRPFDMLYPIERERAEAARMAAVDGAEHP